MSCQNKDFRIPHHTKGTTWDGITFLVSEKDESGDEIPFDFTAASVVAQFRKGKTGPVIFEFKTTDQTIVFGTEETSDPTTGEIVLKPRLMDYKSYDYYFTVRATFPDGRIDEIVEGYFEIED